MQEWSTLPVGMQREFGAALNRLMLIAVDLLEVVAEIEALAPSDNIILGQIEAEGLRAVQALADLQVYDYQLDESRVGDLVEPLDVVTGLLVQRCRALRVPWRLIGDAMRMSAQGALKRATEREWILKNELTNGAE